METDPTPRRILAVDDDEHLRKFITRGLSRVGFEVVAADSGASAIALLDSQTFDCVLCDLHMPDVDGLDVLRHASQLSPRPPFVMLTGYGSVSVAVEAMKRGAADFLEKPVAIDELRATVQAVLSRPPAASSRAPRGASRAGEPPTGLVGSPGWLPSFLESLQRVAQTDATVLIEGETGTGKSVIAREIAKASARASGPFIELNCAAIPEALLENELFGNVVGAFTGATGQSGRVELAAGGTLFLDEVGELKPDLQAKLLQLLQERIFAPVGSNRTRRADVRFIAATNRDLPSDVEAGRFRADLYYRLNVVSLTIPPLRDRLDDVPLLVERFRHRVAERIGAAAPVFPAETLRLLRRYRWPGNVRELENLVERMAVMHAGREIMPDLIGSRFRDPAAAAASAAASASAGRESPAAAAVAGAVAGPLDGALFRPPATEEHPNFHDAVRAYERSMIVKALQNTGGNQTRAAKMLQMNRTTLIEKMRRFGIEDDGSPSESSSDP